MSIVARGLAKSINYKTPIVSAGFGFGPVAGIFIDMTVTMTSAVSMALVAGYHSLRNPIRRLFRMAFRTAEIAVHVSPAETTVMRKSATATAKPAAKQAKMPKRKSTATQRVRKK